MSIEIKAPTFPESVQEGSIATWHKKPGETVSRDDLLVDIETDKVVLEVVAPADGILEKTHKEEVKNDKIVELREIKTSVPIDVVKVDEVSNSKKPKKKGWWST